MKYSPVALLLDTKLDLPMQRVFCPLVHICSMTWLALHTLQGLHRSLPRHSVNVPGGHITHWVLLVLVQCFLTP